MDYSRDVIKRGHLDILREELARLKTIIRNRCETITINSFVEMGIEKIDPEAVFVAADELKTAYAKYMEVKAEIARLEG